MILIAIFPIAYKMLIEPDYRNGYPNLYAQTFINYALITVSMVVLGFALTQGKNMIYKCFGLLNHNDSMNLETLLLEADPTGERKTTVDSRYL